MRRSNRAALLFLAVAGSSAAARVESRAAADAAVPPDTVVAITPPQWPLPSEAASAGVTKFSFIAYGDTRGPHDATELQVDHGRVIATMLAKIKAMSNGPDPVRFVLQSGDAVANGRDAAQWNVGYIPLINRLTAGAGVPYFLATGNHDVTGSPLLSAPARDSGLRNYFGANAKLLPPDGSPRRLSGYPAFGFGFGNTFVLAFDSNITGDSAQFRFVKTQLESLDRGRYKNVVVFFHHPPFSSGPHGGPKLEPQAAVIRELYMPLFRRHHVRLLLAGHEHLFDHWVEHYRDEGGAYRIDEIVTGGGGAPHYAYTGEPDLTAYLKANAQDHVTVEHLARPLPEAAANPFHFVVVHVAGERITIEFVTAEPERAYNPYPGSMFALPERDTVRYF